MTLNEQQQAELRALVDLMQDALRRIDTILVPDRKTLVLEGFTSPGDKIYAIKAIRELTRCGLKEGRELVENGGKVDVWSGLTESQRDQVIKDAERAGCIFVWR